jgi:hypothetical protein
VSRLKTDIPYYSIVVPFLLLLLPHFSFLGTVNNQTPASALLYEKIFGHESLSRYTYIQNTQEPISQNSGGFLLYEDPLLGIRLRYPSDWQQDVTDKSVSFSKIDSLNTPAIFIFTATVDTLEPKIRTLDQFVRAGVGPFREVAGFELEEYDKGATLAGLPAHKVTLIIPYQDATFSKTVSYFAMINNTGYSIAYQVSSIEKEELDRLLNLQLPTFQRMADSFQILT